MPVGQLAALDHRRDADRLVGARRRAARVRRPLVFLVLLLPAINSRPAAVAATVGGLEAVVAAEVRGRLVVADRRGRRRHRGPGTIADARRPAAAAVAHRRGT